MVPNLQILISQTQNFELPVPPMVAQRKLWTIHPPNWHFLAQMSHPNPHFATPEFWALWYETSMWIFRSPRHRESAESKSRRCTCTHVIETVGIHQHWASPRDECLSIDPLISTISKRRPIEMCVHTRLKHPNN
jgi:hypothetical protein